MTRIYVPHLVFSVEHANSFFLDGDAAHHLLNVLRCRVGELVTLFDGHSGEYQTEIIHKEKKRVQLKLIEHFNIQRESPLSIHLIQSVSKGDRMDFVVQKAVELGVNRITPVITQHGAVKVDPNRLLKKVEHWQQIAVHACEQCGRNTIPTIDNVMSWDEMLTMPSDLSVHSWILHPRNSVTVNTQQSITKARLLIGPEGGFSEQEVIQASKADYTAITLGPRILRTETATLAAVTMLQTFFGDLING